LKKLIVSLLRPRLSAGAWSQDVIYRCGNEYTNNVSQAKSKDCKPVDGGHVTVIHGGSKPAAAAGGGSAPRNTAAPAAGSPAPAKVNSSAQKARDSDARAILESELARAQEKLTQLRQEYNDGNPQRTALELRNPQGYQERVEQLKNSITRQEGDVAGIRRELDRLPKN
jgi:predicted lipid-binding transport protein (Tim44 family)